MKQLQFNTEQPLRWLAVVYIVNIVLNAHHQVGSLLIFRLDKSQIKPFFGKECWAWFAEC